jgi:hypothetical protein
MLFRKAPARKRESIPSISLLSLARINGSRKGKRAGRIQLPDGHSDLIVDLVAIGGVGTGIRNREGEGRVIDADFGVDLIRDAVHCLGIAEFPAAEATLAIKDDRILDGPR